jgi:hypothetical protein
MAAQQQQFLVDGPWPGGVDSFLYPTDLVQGTYAWGVNIVNRGGVVQTRPGKHRTISFCGRIAQGAHWCRTVDDQNYVLVAIDGKVYWALFPFLTWTQAANISLNPLATRVWFATGIQAIQYNTDDSIAVLPNPINIVTIQDGTTGPWYWNAVDYTNGQITAGYITGTANKVPMPIGGPMLWKDNYMWLASKNIVYASDLLYPQAFSQNDFLAENTGFRMPRAITNMIPSPEQGVLVETDSSLHSLQSFIQDRTQWSSTQGFQADINTEVGLVAPFAIAYMHGMPWMLTARGLISYDRAQNTTLTSVILTQDGEMMRSKQLLSQSVTRSCMGVWENCLLLSVPASSPYNRHTWVLDAGISQKLNNDLGMCWSGIWTGTFPVQFVSPIVNGVQHIYELSYSSGYLALNQGESPSPMNAGDGALPPQANIHFYENMIPNQIDDVESSINCSFETRAFILNTDDYYRFVFAEFMLVHLRGIVKFQVYVSGLAGNYQPLFSTTLRADIGPWGNDQDAVLYYVAGAGEQVPEGTTTEFENYRSQVRHLRSTEYIVHQSKDGAACTEIQRLDGVDKAFQLLIQWQGRLGIRQLKFFYDRQLQSPLGICPTDESDTPHITLEATA